MQTARKFQDLVAWQLCTELRDLVLALTDSGRCLSDFDFRDHIGRAAKSAPRLISEGFLRYTPEEFVRYLRMARAEIGEIQNELEYERTRKYFTEEQSAKARDLATRAMVVTTRLLASKLPLLKERQASRRSPPGARETPKGAKTGESPRARKAPKAR